MALWTREVRMSLRTLVFSILCGIAYSASGTTAPYIPPEKLPPSTNPVLPPNPPVHVARLDQSPLMRKHVQGLHLSGTAHALLMRQFAASPNVTALAPPLARSRGRRPVASVETYATTPARVSDDGFQDVEPQTVSAVYGFRGRWTVFAYAKFVRIEGAMWPQLYTRRTANLSTFGAEQPLPLVAPYTIAYDAALAVNPYGGGVS